MDKLAIHPPARLNERVSLPGSKSYTNRALAIAALAEGTTVLNRPLLSDDTLYMRRALRELGIEVDDSQAERFVVDGRGGQFHEASGDLYLGNAGTATRFLTSIACLVPGRTVITGDDRMQERPIGPLLDALTSLGADVVSIQDNGCPPLAINSDQLRGGEASMRGDISSQYFSSIMMTAPFAQSDVTLHVEGEQSSKPYIDITLDIMQQFGVSVENDDYQRYHIQSGVRYQAGEYTVEADASSASYFMVIAALTGRTLRIGPLNPNSKQGDIRFKDVLRQMGCTIEEGPLTITVSGPDQLKAVDVDMNDMPDMVQSLAMVAALAEGETVIRNVANLRVKETDRLQALTTELNKLGVKAESTHDSLRIQGRDKLKGGEVATYEDHRMAMAFAALGTRVSGIVIQDPGVVSKSFPTYWDVLNELGIETEEVS